MLPALRAAACCVRRYARSWRVPRGMFTRRRRRQRVCGHGARTAMPPGRARRRCMPRAQRAEVRVRACVR